MRPVALLLAVGLLGCGGNGTGQEPAAAQNPDLMPGFQPDAAPANGFQVLLPIVHGLQPGTDNELCTWTDHVLTDAIDVKSAQGFQSLSGHHIAMYYTTKLQPAGTTRVCTDDDMSTFRFSVATGNEGNLGTGLASVAPGDLVFHIPAGSQIVLNHHYINATPNVIDAQSALNVALNTPGAPAVHSGSLAMVNSQMKLAPGQPAIDISCKMQEDMAMWETFPHMHAYGKHVSVNLVSGGKTSSLFDVAWEPAYQFHPPAIIRDPNAPLVFSKGDQVNIHCEWDNTTGKTLTFGLEMCVLYGATINTKNLPNAVCDVAAPGSGVGSWGTF